MTNTRALQGLMKEKGYTIEKLAKTIGLSTTGFFNKLHSKRQFLVSEVQLIGEALSMSDKDICNVFFAKNVEFNSTI